MRFGILALLPLILANLANAEEPAPEQIEFFEQNIRPLFAEHCWKCHGPDQQKGGLRLDSRATALTGGDTGPAMVPGNADESELVRAVRYDPDGYQMPPDGKLPPEKIALIERWVSEGAAWPEGEVAASTGDSWKEQFTERAQHWSFRPLAKPAVPRVHDSQWARTPIDRFILNALEAQGLSPAPPAEISTLLRRAKFDIVGLPPTLDEMERITDHDALARKMELWLADPHFGERWGRHWLDLVRFAETRGHEFDYDVPNAWHYRDYTIRAMNADVPYDQFVVEHVAGDLISMGRDAAGYATRVDPATGIGESILGTGFWYFGDSLHSPVDLKQDEADRTMNMVEVFSKTFLSMTVSCARCHDHKFDPISQRDYYALAGFVASGCYEQVPFQTREHNARIADELQEIDREARQVLRQWLDETHQAPPVSHDSDVLPNAAPNVEIIVDYRKPTTDVISNGFAFNQAPRQVGDVRWGASAAVPIAAVVESSAVERDRVWDACHSAADTGDDLGVENWNRAGRTLITPSFTVGPGKVYAWVRGGCRAYAAVNNYLTIKGPLHTAILKEHAPSPEWHWIEHDLTRYVGHPARMEFTLRESDDFAVALVVQADAPPPAPFEASAEALSLNTRLSSADANDSARLELYAKLGPLFERREALRSQIQTVSEVAPVMLEGSGVDQPLFIRGNPHKTGAPVPRRFLEVFAETSEPTAGSPACTPFSEETFVEARAVSPRLDLALRMVDPTQSPITARVIANRVWLHYFGVGLVTSPDDFGLMGADPSHPELLDWLACELIEHQWSLKHLHRLILDSAVYRQASYLDPAAGPERQAAWDAAEQADPTDTLLHRMRIRRLEGEALRDAILSASGRLDEQMYGRSVPIHLTEHHEGRGRPAVSGPVDGAGRRSLYITVRRNFPDPFLQAFDFPVPSTTRGRRSTSNVPAQALALMNNPFVIEEAKRFAARLVEEAPSGDEAVEDRVRRAFRLAWSREPTPEEVATAEQFIADEASTRGDEVQRAWTDLCHALINAKEFAFIP